jgi:hypothetical protein
MSKSGQFHAGTCWHRKFFALFFCRGLSLQKVPPSAASKKCEKFTVSVGVSLKKTSYFPLNANAVVVCWLSVCAVER